MINPYYITGIDAELLEELKKEHDVVITLEDGFLKADSVRRLQDSMGILI